MRPRLIYHFFLRSSPRGSPSSRRCSSKKRTRRWRRLSRRKNQKREQWLNVDERKRYVSIAFPPPPQGLVFLFFLLFSFFVLDKRLFLTYGLTRIDNASNFTTGQTAASFTSTALEPTTKNDKALFDEVRWFRSLFIEFFRVSGLIEFY